MLKTVEASSFATTGTNFILKRINIENVDFKFPK